MADEIDLANDLINNQITYALTKLRQDTILTPGSEFCHECGDSIPRERQKLGFKYCVPCAQDAERRKLLFA
ncbi:MAG: hypothetical protein A3F11_05460 [Gammaproteobacteria bacterium RIFCSPHIGHO2_12_FULL_37_14]|nr:MAG: hypothetical protein A3F11_05460 [Gammaproteobacteria bacterium RIFCSPHIGHO2_12_FULL_37_14]